METYGGDFERLRLTFVRFLENLPFYGLAVLCIDDPVIRRTLPDIARPVLTYGFSMDADIHIKADSVRFDGLYSHFEVIRNGAKPLSLQLKLPGRHNILNAAAAIGVATEIGVSDEAIQRALLCFGGVGRRVEHLGLLSLPDERRVMVIDDYGHHPREVEVTLEALRSAYPGQRVVMVFQPHRYTRTRDLFQDFSQVLQKVDRLYLLDVYSAGEAPIAGADSASLCQTIPGAQTIAQQAPELLALLQAELHDNDILVFQGAGSVSHFAKQVSQHAKQV
jgi:UDP-N-acetylmuramate--alanine ligase